MCIGNIITHSVPELGVDLGMVNVKSTCECQVVGKLGVLVDLVDVVPVCHIVSMITDSNIAGMKVGQGVIGRLFNIILRNDKLITWHDSGDTGCVQNDLNSHHTNPVPSIFLVAVHQSVLLDRISL